MRTRRTRQFGAAAVALATGAVLAGCAGPQDTAGAGAGSSTLNVYLYQKPKLFSPLAPGNGPDQTVMSMVFDSMLGLDARSQLQPHLTTAQPTVSPDARTFTFHLKPDLKWSDGKPFTSKDVLFTYNLMANPRSGSAWAGSFAQVEGADAVKKGSADTLSGLTAPDAHTVVIRTTAPDVGAVATLGTISLLPEHVLGSVPLDQVAKNAFFHHPTVGLGPYRFVTYKTDQYVELKANSRFRSPVNIKRVLLKTVSSDVATAQLGTGEMDLAQISPTDLPAVEKTGGVSVRGIDGTGYTRIAVNQTQKRFADVRVRQALLYAVDRKKIIDTVLAGKGAVVNSSFFGPAGADGLNAYPYDPAKARKLLREAGWDASKPVTLEWVPGQRDRDTAATIVQSQLQAVGVKVKLKQTQVAQLLDSYADKSYDLALFGGGNYVTEPWAAQPILACDQGYPAGGNIPFFCDKDLDRYLEKANGTADRTERLALYKKAAAIENEQASYLWLNSPQTLWAATKRLHGAKLTSYIAQPFVDIQDWKLS